MTPPPPDGFRYYTPVTVRYGDMDTLGHVNNAKYLTYIEHARIAYFHEQQLWDGSLSKIGAIVARISMDYKLPLTLSDGTVDLWTRCSRIGNKSFDIESLIITYRDDVPQVAASATTVLVAFDYVTNSSLPIPQDWRDKLITYEPSLSSGD